MRAALRTELRSAVGAHRSANQDAVGASDCCAVVADGVGGRVAGDVASAAVTHAVLTSLTSAAEEGWADIEPERLREVVAAANARLATLSAADPSLMGLATTFTAIVCVEDAALVAHIGDSRAYLVQSGSGRRVTRDDSLVQELVDQGTVDPADAWLHPHRNIILWSLAGDPDDPRHLTVQRTPTAPGDRWLLASDGLTDYVPEQLVLEVLAGEPDAAIAADRLMAMALAADARDNVTLAVIDVVEPVPDGAARGPETAYRTAGSALALGAAHRG